MDDRTFQVQGRSGLPPIGRGGDHLEGRRRHFVRGALGPGLREGGIGLLAAALFLAPGAARAAGPGGPARPEGTAVAPEPDVRAILARALDDYEVGDFAAATTAVEAALASGAVRTDAERREAYRILGMAYHGQGDLTRAEEAFRSLLLLDHDHRLPASVAPPDTIRFFEELRLRLRPALAASAPSPPLLSDADVLPPQQIRKSVLLAMLPPAGQFQNGHTGKAFGVMALEVVFLGAAAGSYAWLRANRQEPGGFFEDPDLARKVRVANWASLVALAATAALGALDGLLHLDEPAVDGL